MAGAPLGNTNSAKGRPWAAAINRALEKRSRIEQKEALDDLAEKLLENCDAGDMTALKELGDRLDGKPQQSIDTKMDATVSIQRVEVVIVDPAISSPA